MEFKWKRTYFSQHSIFFEKIGPFFDKILCCFHVKHRKKAAFRRPFRVLLLCWCKCTTPESEKQMLINLFLHSAFNAVFSIAG